MNDTYICCILRVTLLAPEVAEAILDGRNRMDPLLLLIQDVALQAGRLRKFD